MAQRFKNPPRPGSALGFPPLAGRHHVGFEWHHLWLDGSKEGISYLMMGWEAEWVSNSPRATKPGHHGAGTVFNLPLSIRRFKQQPSAGKYCRRNFDFLPIDNSSLNPVLICCSHLRNGPVLAW